MDRPAPLDLSAVALAGRPLGEARMLPGPAYLDDGVLAWEREHLFATSWLCAGRADMVERPGDQAAVAVGASSVLVSRAVECQWLFPRDVVRGGHFDPSYAVDFWDLTNRQDWAAIESVQRGIANPSFLPGPFAPKEDAVHRFVRRVSARYLGH